MASPKHRPEESQEPEERGGEALNPAGGQPEPAGASPSQGGGPEDLVPPPGPGGEEAAPEFFVMEPEPPEKEEAEEFVLAPEGDVLPQTVGVGAKGELGEKGEEDPEWLLRGGDEVMEANEGDPKMAPLKPDEVGEMDLEAVPAGAGASAEPPGRIRRIFKFGSIAAAALLLLTLGIVSLRGGFGSKEPVKVARAEKAPSPPPEPVRPPVPEPPAPRPPTPEPPPAPPPDEPKRTEPEPATDLAPAPPTVPTGPQGPISIRTPGGEFVLLKAGEVLLTLRNGNFFTGRIYRINAEELTLRVPGGEIVFGMKSLAKIVPLAGADKEKDELAHLPSGYVELHNGNRIWGKILEETPEHAAIAFAAAKITIPRASIRAVVRSATATVGIAE